MHVQTLSRIILFGAGESSVVTGFFSDYPACVVLCNGMNIVEATCMMFESVIDSWGAFRWNINYGQYFFFDAVYVGSPVIIMLQKIRDTVEKPSLACFKTHSTNMARKVQK